MKNLLPLYARHEPPSDSASLDYAKASGWTPTDLCREVVIYSDPEAQNRVAHYPWHYAHKPTRRNKYIMHNCTQYSLTWLPEAKAKGE